MRYFRFKINNKRVLVVYDTDYDESHLFYKDLYVGNIKSRLSRKNTIDKLHYKKSKLIKYLRKTSDRSFTLEMFEAITTLESIYDVLYALQPK